MLNNSRLFFNPTYKNMKTAVQELFSKLETEHPNLFNIHTVEGRDFINNYYYILEMEKQQIIDAYITGKNDNYIDFRTEAKQYYNETFILCKK